MHPIKSQVNICRDVLGTNLKKWHHDVI